MNSLLQNIDNLITFIDNDSSQKCISSINVNSNQFKIISFNILADCYALSNKTYPKYCSKQYLNGDYRFHFITTLLSKQNADIIALQEVDQPELIKFDNKLYKTFFQKKPNKKQDGLLLAFNKHKFCTYSNSIATCIQLNDLSYGTNSENSKVYYRRNCIALYILLTPINNNKHIFIIVNTHLYYHRDSDDIRLRQVAYIMNTIYSKYMGVDYFKQDFINLTVDVHDNRFMLFVNNEFIVQYTDNCDPVYLSGSVGLRSYESISTFTYLSIDLNPSYIPSEQYNPLDIMERNSLYAIYNTMNGQYWYSLWNYSYIASPNACNELCGIVCKSQNGITNIISLSLVNNNLSGIITEGIQHLTQITTLDLANNGLTGSIPNLFSSFSNLVVLKLENNKLISDIPDSIQYATNLCHLKLNNNYLSGGIDILSDNIKLEELYLDNNAFNGDLSAMCSLEKMILIGLNGNKFSGTFPNCVGNLNNLRDLIMSENNISGTIPHDICNASSITKINLGKMKLNGTIPTCISQMKNLIELILLDNYLISTIPTEICKLTSLKLLVLSNNILTGSIPSCIWSTLINLEQIHLSNNSLTEIEIKHYPPNIQVIEISDNKLSGDMIPFHDNLTSLTKIMYHNNNFENDLSKLFMNYQSFTNADAITLHKNNFFHEDITDLLGFWLYNLTKIRIISLFNNADIKGFFPSAPSSKTFCQGTLEYLTIHHNKLRGSLPSNVQFQKLKAISLFDNQLSCNIPSTFVSGSAHTSITDLKLMILPSNWFEFNIDHTQWMHSSHFKESFALYIDRYDIIKSYIIGIMAIVLSSILYLHSSINYFSSFFSSAKTLQSQRSVSDSLPRRKFAESDLNSISLHFSKITEHLCNNYKIMIIAAILQIIYACTPNYFACIVFIDSLSFTFYFDKDGDLYIVNIIVCVMWITLIYLMGTLISSTQLEQYAEKTAYEQRRPTLHTSVNRDYKLWITFVMLLFSYFIFIMLLVIYISNSSLPSDNISVLSGWKIKLIEKSMSFILTVSNALIIPKLISVSYQLIRKKHPDQSLKFLSTYRPTIIFMLRSFTTIILPMCLSVLLLHDCGRFWTTFWTHCAVFSESASDLDIETNLSFQIATSASDSVLPFNQHITVQLLKSDDICTPKTWKEINWNKCVRQFCSNWIIILIQKILIMHFMPIIIICGKLIAWKLIKYVKCDIVKDRIKKMVSLKIDKEYAMILNKMETMIVYSWIFPLLTPLTIISIVLNLYVYDLVVSEKGTKMFGVRWEFNPSNKYLQPPVYLLWIAIAFAQILITTFSSALLHSPIYSYCMVPIWVIIDLHFGFKVVAGYWTQKRLQQSQVMEMSSYKEFDMNKRLLTQQNNCDMDDTYQSDPLSIS
eukprot:502056_1